MTDLGNKLAEIGHKISDAEKSRVFLRGLRAEFDVTVEVIRATDKSVSEVISKIVVFEASTKDFDSLILLEHGNAFNNPLEYSCKHCGRLGHHKRHCFHNPECKKNRKNMKGGHQNEWKNKVFKVDLPGTAYTAFVACRKFEKNTKSQKWIFDSGASAHM